MTSPSYQQQQHDTQSKWDTTHNCCGNLPLLFHSFNLLECDIRRVSGSVKSLWKKYHWICCISSPLDFTSHRIHYEWYFSRHQSKVSVSFSFIIPLGQWNEGFHRVYFMHIHTIRQKGITSHSMLLTHPLTDIFRDEKFNFHLFPA